MRQDARKSRNRSRVRPAVEALEGRQLATAGLGGSLLNARAEVTASREQKKAAQAAADLAAPQLIRKQLVISGDSAIGIALTFSEPLAPGPATDIRNYAVGNISTHNPFDWAAILLPFWWPSAKDQIQLKAAVYDQSTNTVILIPTKPLQASGEYQVVTRLSHPRLTASGNSRYPRPLSDTSGDTLQKRIDVAVTSGSTVPRE